MTSFLRGWDKVEEGTSLHVVREFLSSCVAGGGKRQGLCGIPRVEVVTTTVGSATRGLFQVSGIYSTRTEETGRRSGRSSVGLGVYPQRSCPPDGPDVP